MVTEEERESIILEAMERTILMIPEIMGNLMVQIPTARKINSEFYKKYPEFLPHKDLVQMIVGEIDGMDTLAGLEEKINKSVPIIRERLKTMKSLDMKNVSNNPDRNLIDITTNKQHGEI